MMAILDLLYFCLTSFAELSNGIDISSKHIMRSHHVFYQLIFFVDEATQNKIVLFYQ